MAATPWLVPRVETKSFSYVVADLKGAQATGSGSITVTSPCP